MHWSPHRFLTAYRPPILGMLRSRRPSLSQTHHGLRIPYWWRSSGRCRRCGPMCPSKVSQHISDNVCELHLRLEPCSWPSECDMNMTAAVLLPSDSYQNVSYNPGTVELCREDSAGTCRSSSVKLWQLISTESHAAYPCSRTGLPHPSLHLTVVDHVPFLRLACFPWSCLSHLRTWSAAAGDQPCNGDGGPCRESSSALGH